MGCISSFYKISIISNLYMSSIVEVVLTTRVYVFAFVSVSCVTGFTLCGVYMVMRCLRCIRCLLSSCHAPIAVNCYYHIHVLICWLHNKQLVAISLFHEIIIIRISSYCYSLACYTGYTL